MTRYILDTDTVSAMMRNPAGKIASQITRVGEDSVSLSIITAAELRFGAAKSGSSRRLARVEALLQRMPIHSLDVPVDAEYGSIRVALVAAGQPIGPNNLLMGAHARTLGATIVTGNIGELRRIQGLSVDNWMA